MEFYIETPKFDSGLQTDRGTDQVCRDDAAEIRNGDMLPSIRNIEKQTDVHYSQIHKAYLALRQSGLLVPTRRIPSVKIAAN
jgi:DNA-binding transcriptional regulator YhcF (GntR family)